MQDRFFTDKQLQTTYQVLCPPEMHIPVPANELVEALKESIPQGCLAKFGEIVDLVFALSEHEFGDVKRKVKKNFKVFSTAAKGKQPVSKGNRGMPDSSELKYREQQFLEEFARVMEIAHFHQLSQFEWEQALAEEYQFTMPVEVQWDHMDGGLFKGFWEQNETLRKRTFEHADKVMVFHRGVGVAKKKDMFINEKIDLGVEYLITQPVNALINTLMSKKKGKDTPANGKSRNAPILEVSVSKQHSNLVPGYQPRVIERKTLKRQLPNVSTLLRGMAKQIELQEPTYKDVVIVYRKAAPKMSKQELAKLTNKERERLRLEKRNIHIKSFEEIAMADMEMIFPGKKVHLKAVFKIQVISTLLAAFVGFIVTLFTSIISWNLVLSSIGVIGGRLMQVYTQQTAARAQMMQDMSMQLYDKSLDSQEGVLYYLLDEMGEQFTRELLLCYAMLVREGGPLSIEALDAKCQEWLEEMYQLKLDFSVDTTVQKCIDYKLVQPDAQGLYKATPLAEAIQHLTNAWSVCFKDQDEQPPNTSPINLLGGPTRIIGNTVSFASKGVGAIGAGAVAGATTLTSNVSSLGKGVSGASKKSLGMLGLKKRRDKKDEKDGDVFHEPVNQ